MHFLAFSDPPVMTSPSLLAGLTYIGAYTELWQRAQRYIKRLREGGYAAGKMAQCSTAGLTRGQYGVLHLGVVYC